MIITPLENWISEKTGIPGRPILPKLREYQLHKLRETLRHVLSNSRFYGERLRGVAPDSVKNMEDVAALPFTYPEDITARGTDFLCVSPRDIGRIVTLSTSGTTGSPKRIYFTDADQELTIDFFHHGMTTFTDASDRLMIFMPGNTEGSVGDLLKKGLARFNCESIVYGPIKDYADALKTLAVNRITSIVGIPSQVLALSRYQNETSFKLTIKSILLSADYVPASAAASLSDAWGAAVYGHYGMTETGLGGGVECSARDGYHLREADLLFEIVDPASGLPAEDGNCGEVVISTLTRTGMPLIRYRTGDRARFIPQSQPCPCGTVLRRLDRVSGRIKEAVPLSGGESLSITQLDEIVLADRNVLKYAAEITTENGEDCLWITVQPVCGGFEPERLTRNLNAFCHTYLQKHRLAIRIHSGDIGFFTTGTSKRYIIDNRKK